MGYKNIEVCYDNNCAFIVLKRTEQLNALNVEMLNELCEAVLGINTDITKCLIIKSKSEKAFIAGADIKEMANFSKEEATNFSLLGKRTLNLIERLPIPTIALINGYALGGGLELALSCDLRISSTKSKFGLPEVGLGIFPGFNGIIRLTKTIGESKAKKLAYSGSIINSNDAYCIGLVDYLFGNDNYEEESTKIIQSIVNNPKQSLDKIKNVFVNIANGTNYDDSVLFGECFETDIQKNNMNSFLKK